MKQFSLNMGFRQRTGYFLVDHRHSPGLTEEQARQAGYDPKSCGEGQMWETHALGCCECKSSVIPNPARTRARATCKYDHPGHYICDGCDFLQNQPGYIGSRVERLVNRYTGG